MKHLSRGFTIVELLIVIIVVGILASISVVGYRGSQDRAEFARAQTDLKHINDALIVYKAQNGRYPATGTTSTWDYQFPSYSSTRNTIFLSELVPTYLDKMPIGKSNASFYYSTYAYNSDGTDYKLIRMLRNTSAATYTGLPGVELNNNPLLDGERQNWAWGYWTSAWEDE